MLLYSDTELENNRTVQVIAFAEKPMTAGRFNVSLYEHDGELVDDVEVTDLLLAVEAVNTLTFAQDFDHFRLEHQFDERIK